jgi:hypothetical protein
MVPVGRVGDAKIGNNIFQTGQIQHLHIEFRNERQWCCCRSEMGSEMREKAVTSGHKQSQAVYGLSTIEKRDLHKNGENA